MGKKSFVRKTLSLLLANLIILILLLILYISDSYRNAVERVEDAAANFVQLYGNELQSKIEGEDSQLENMLYDNSNLVMLQSTNENERYYAAIAIKEQLDSELSGDRYASFAVAAERDYENFICAAKGAISEELRLQLKEFTLNQVAENRVQAAWNFVEFGGQMFLYKMYVWQGRGTGIFMSVDSFMESEVAEKFEDMGVLLLGGDGAILASYGDDVSEIFPDDPAERAALEDGSRVGGYLVRMYSLGDGAYTLQIYTRLTEVRRQFGGGAILVFGVILLSVIFGVMLTGSIRREVLVPTQKIQSHMDRIKEGDYKRRIEDEFGSREFESVKYSFNKMMDEIVNLKIERYEKQIALSESELKSIRLTIKPHFFLNALTTISSLSMQGKNKEIKTYIDALSKNVRYMFKSGFHTVELSEELTHVENYFEMQELKYPGCVFYFIEMEEELGTWRIPQMLLHTIIENEYKYAVSVDQMLSILIKVSKVTRDGEELLCIEIEDDGKGYPDEVLESFRNQSASGENGTRVGLWSLRRMLELMYEQEGLFEISNISPHGCMNRFRIPKQAVHEVTKE
jgi:sensor histidine kinase YesM